MKKIAILYQNGAPPPQGGIRKPMKPGGYSDSGADIACCLNNRGIEVVTPEPKPDAENDYHWVFPDTKEGIEAAIAQGANVFWLNTVLYKDHPIVSFFGKEIEIVGQPPALVDRFDDKLLTNDLLKNNGLPIPAFFIIEKNQQLDFSGISFPKVVKPIRGRGSQGVSIAENRAELSSTANQLLASRQFGDAVYIEQYLPGKEMTITVMPPGVYWIDGQEEFFDDHWVLPPVERFNHINGIAPYNGVVAVVHNSKVLPELEIQSEQVQLALKHCQKAASLAEARAPIRIDCRADKNGRYFLFDLNMKPNMTGASRKHRQDQDSLTMIAAREIGWSYFDLLRNMLNQKWKPVL